MFTDVEGSTRLWEAEPDPMAQALRRHDEMLRAAISRAGGFVFKTAGDAFCAAFATPQAGLDAALAAQKALAAEPWPTSQPIRVRMSLHTGVCEERDNDYFGPVVNRAARLGTVAHGGQVLVSGATAELLSEALPEGVGLRDLGAHRLKDLGRPEHVFQLEAGCLPSGFPALGTLDNPELPNNLPGLLSAFVGREREVDEVGALVGSNRLVTLTGAGGCGKTRLALQAAAEVLDGAGDGVWFVELAPLAEPGKIPEAVAAALGLADDGGRQPRSASLSDVLREQDTLILLDNCEHLIDGAAKFCGQILRDCPRLRILATSREPLGLDGEHVYRVPSLSLPPGEAEAVDDIAAADAVRLFVDRARAHHSGFVLDETSAPVVASVCRRLDGIPLALELAAARLSSMSIRQVSERLGQRFRLLTGGSRNAMPRQQTLQAAVDWSFGLLTQPERDVLRRLSVFAGSFELEAAEVICASGAVDAFDAADLLGSLVSKSLVVADRTARSVRYRMLETIRQYAADRLAEASEDQAAVVAAHCAHYLAAAETAAPHLTGPDQGSWLTRLDADRANFRRAAEHAAGEPDGTSQVLRFGVALWRYWLVRYRKEEAVALLVPALRRPEAAADPALFAEALVAAARVTVDTDLATSIRLAEQADEVAGGLGDARLLVMSRAHLARAYSWAGEPERARALALEAVGRARQLGDDVLLGTCLMAQAHAVGAAASGPLYAEAIACTERSATSGSAGPCTTMPGALPWR